jgi:hypothetical protein
VRALLASCDRRRAGRCRDLTMMTLLARMGLRVGEVGQTLARLARQAGLPGGSSSCRPRPHDLRYFAVASLLDWCRDSSDIASRMPLPSACPGHASPEDPYWYLSAYPDRGSLPGDGLRVRRRADPGAGGDFRWLGRSADEPLGVGGVGGAESGGSLAADGGGVPMVEVSRGVQADSRVPVVVVVPGQERLAVCPGGLDRAEPGREPGPVFQGLELRL